MEPHHLMMATKTPAWNEYSTLELPMIEGNEEAA
jgi:hypothetical protein